MSGKMSVKERLSLEFVTAKGAVAYSGASCPGAQRQAKLATLPDFDLFDESAASLFTAAVESSADLVVSAVSNTDALDAVADLKALFAAVGEDSTESS